MEDHALTKLREKEEAKISNAKKVIATIDRIQQEREEKARADEIARIKREELNQAEKISEKAAQALSDAEKTLQELGVVDEAPSTESGQDQQPQPASERNKGGRGKDKGPRKRHVVHELSGTERIKLIIERIVTIDDFQGHSLVDQLHFGWPFIGATLQLLAMLPEPIKIVFRREGSPTRAIFMRTALGDQLHEAFHTINVADGAKAKKQLEGVASHFAYLIEYYKVEGINDKKAVMSDVYTSAILAYNREPVVMIQNVPDLKPAPDTLHSMGFRLLKQKLSTEKSRKLIPKNLVPMPKSAKPWACTKCTKSYRYASQLIAHARRKHPDALAEIREMIVQKQLQKSAA